MTTGDRIDTVRGLEMRLAHRMNASGKYLRCTICQGIWPVGGEREHEEGCALQEVIAYAYIGIGSLALTPPENESDVIAGAYAGIRVLEQFIEDESKKDAAPTDDLPAGVD